MMPRLNDTSPSSLILFFKENKILKIRGLKCRRWLNGELPLPHGRGSDWSAPYNVTPEKIVTKKKLEKLE
jgi:hypothetical protein